MTPTVRRRAILLARLSDNREDLDLTDEGIPKSLDDQIRRMREKADQLGWEVWKVIKNPRLSAYKRKKIQLPGGRVDYRVFRPDLREAMDDLWHGRANAMLALDLDRAFRDPADLDDLVKVVEGSAHDIVVESVTGTLHIHKGDDNFAAEVQVLVARKASKDTARRVAAARERRAREGKFGGGKRPYGFESDGITIIESEAEVIKTATRAILAGGTSLRAITQGLRTNGVPTVKGGVWDTSSLKDILLRPRNAGILVYRGKEIEGAKAPWDAIVEIDEFRAVVSKLTARRASPGRATKWLGSNLYRCPCGGVLQAHAQKTRAARYRCRDTGRMAGEHTSRVIADLDEFVTKTIISFCCRPDAMDRLQPGSLKTVDADALRAEAAAINEALLQAARDWGADIITRAQLAEYSQIKREALRLIEEQLLSASRESATAGLVQAGANAADLEKRRARIRAEWDKYTIGAQRAILRELMVVHVLKAKSGPGFDPSRLKIEWNL